MWRCGLMLRTRVLRFVWKQSYRDLLPPAAASAYVCGQLRLCDSCAGGGVPVVLESPSDAAGIYSFSAQSTASAVRALRDVTRSADSLSITDRRLALDGLAVLLRENADLLASADALVTGMCLRDARRSLDAALNFVMFCEQRLRTPTAAEAEATVVIMKDAASVDAEEVLHSFGCGSVNNLSDSHAVNTPTVKSSVALCVTAANYPLQWGMETLATALLRGSAAVWLPSLDTPLSALWLMHLLHRSNRNAVAGSREAVNVILCRADDVVATFAKQQESGFSIVGLTNGFMDHQLRRIHQAHGNSSATSHGSISCITRWYHRVMKPSLAIVGSGHHHTETMAVRLDASRVAARICQHAFHGNGRMLYALHIAFVPKQDVLSVLQSVVQYVRNLRLGHSLDPSVNMGPLSGAAHMAAMKETVEAAVCCGDVKLQHVCGGFDVAMPAGFFCLPCAFYGTVANVAPAETEMSIRFLCETTARLRCGLDRLGGGPFVVVCGYDPPQQREALEVALRDTEQYVLHYW
ncbi:hypothetical protein MOQ_001627 [Trypanosoma cruzi marinkellei]|uniref:Aldehyde dehydrogenase domain-containing protein n=1 Tax=Trypanosoma cruzi marinkellei TaxID=85056 RepID=K2NT40_TRYCR|nr:hypothetical protein MOQ_001627 [Trypanosoma cruzi marinkellei]